MNVEVLEGLVQFWVIHPILTLCDQVKWSWLRSPAATDDYREPVKTFTAAISAKKPEVGDFGPRSAVLLPH